MPNCLLWREVIWFFSQSWLERVINHRAQWRKLRSKPACAYPTTSKELGVVVMAVWQHTVTPSGPNCPESNSCLSFPPEKQRELGLHLSKFLQLWYLLSLQLKLQERPGHLEKWSLCPWSRVPDAQLTPPPASPWKTNPLWNLFGFQKIPEYISKHHLFVLCFSILSRISLEVCEKAGMKAQGSHARGWSAWEWSDAGWVTVLLQG